MNALLAHLSASETLFDKGMTLASHLVLALLILWIGWIIAARVSRIMRAALQRSDKVDPTLRPILVSTADWILKIVVVALALSQVGVQIAAIVTLLGAAGLAVGLALQGTLQNIAAGIMLILLRPFQVGDYIESDGGVAGTILEVGLFNTKLEKADGVYVFVPNGKLWSGSITNYSRNEKRRLELLVKVDYHTDPAVALQVLTGYLNADQRVLSAPSLQVVVSNVDNTGTEITLRAWTLRTTYWDLRYDLNAGLRSTLSKAGISMVVPAPQVALQDNGRTTPTLATEKTGN